MRLRPPGEPREARAAAPPPPCWRLGEAPSGTHASAPGAPRPAQVRPLETEATSATARAPLGPLREALPGGERGRSASGSVVGPTPRLPRPSLRRLPIQPGGFCLVQHPRITAAPSPASPDAAGRARRSSAPLGKSRSPGAAARGAAAERGRGGTLGAHSPAAIGRTDFTNANFYWLAVAWGGARGGRAGLGRSDWCTRGSGPASLRPAGVGGRGVGGRRRQEREESAREAPAFQGLPSLWFTPVIRPQVCFPCTLG